MFFDRFLPVIVSVFCAAGLCLLGTALAPSDASVGGAHRQKNYAVLICNSDIPDREIRERLENQGLTDLVSESGQWFLLDSFGSIEQIPLDEYDSRLLPFDPRNDGYAQNLRALFVRDGKRHIYIPIRFPASAKPASMKKKIAAALGNIPYSFEYSRSGRRADLFRVFFFLAACFLVILRPLRSSLQPHAAVLIPCLPMLAPLVLVGDVNASAVVVTYGIRFALASILTGFAVLAAVLSYNRFVMHRIVRRILPPLLLICYIAAALLSDLPPVFTLLELILLCAILAFSLRHAARVDSGLIPNRQNQGRRRFTPVTILKRPASAFIFAWAMLPFAMMGVVFSLTIPGALGAPKAKSLHNPPAAVLTETDYQRHYRFQSTFSHRALHDDAANAAASAAASADPHVYEFASDGLIVQVPGGTVPPSGYSGTPGYPGAPPFPLGDLSRYLNESGSVITTGTARFLLLTLLPLLFILPAFLYRILRPRGMPLALYRGVDF